MAHYQNRATLRHIQSIFADGVGGELTDRQLLERFTSAHSDSDGRGERAFEALVARHGPMVFRVCRSALKNEHDAQDAFQAVFLVLVQKSHTIWARDSLGPWLHAVALRVTARAREAAARRGVHEQRCAETVVHSTLIDQHPATTDIVATIHQELGRLPDRYRKPLILCDLQGLTHLEAARRLGWPVGTVKSRQARGRDRLRARLTRRGIVPAITTILSSLAADPAYAAVPIKLSHATIKLALMVWNGGANATALSAAAIALSQAAISTMFLTRVRLAAVVLFSLTIATTSAGLALHSTRGESEAPAEPPDKTKGIARTKQPISTLASLNAADVPADKRFPDMPENVVAVLGEIQGRHAGRVQGIALSTNGKILATAADQDTNVNLWNPKTLQPISRLPGNRAPVACVAISPDNHWIAAGSAYGDFFIWDLTALPSRVLMSVSGRFGNNSHAAVFSPDSKRLAVAGNAGSVDLFELANGTFQERGLLPGVDQEVHALAFAADARTLALSGLDDGTVRLFDITAKPPRPINTLLSTEPEDPKLQAIGVQRRLDAPAGPRWPPLRVGSVAFAPDGKSLVALDATGRVRLWDLSAKSPVDQGLLDFRQQVLEARCRPSPGLGAGSDRDLPMVTFSPDGALIAAAQQDGYVRLWDRTQPKPRERVVFAAHRDNVSVLAFSPDSKMLFTGGSDHLIRRWDVMPKTPVETPQSQGPIGGLGAIAFSPDGSRLAVTDDEYTRIWNLSDARSESRLPAPRTTIPVGATRALAFSPNGKNLVIGEDWAMPPSLWAITGATPVRIMSLHPSSPVTGLYRQVSVSFAVDGHTMALGSREPMIQIWDMSADPPRPRHVIRADDPETAHIVALSPDGAYLAFSDSKEAVRIWLLTGAKPSEQAKLEGNGSRIWSLKFSPDGKTLAMGSNGRMRLVKISGAEFEWLHPSTNKLGFRSPVDIDRSFGFSTAFSRDGKHLIAADQISSNVRSAAEPALCVYDIATGKRFHEWHLPAPCWAIALAPDDDHVAAAMQNGVAYIFRIPESTGKGQGPK